MIIKVIVIGALLIACSFALLEGAKKILTMRRDFSKRNNKK